LNVTFGICADLHNDFIHDSVERVEGFQQACVERKVDFCVELGDFCPPERPNDPPSVCTDKKRLLALLRNWNTPFYHVLGNHDMDDHTKQAVIDYLDMKGAHYSFDCGGVHFIVLDACFYQVGDQYYPYDLGNYKQAPPHAQVPVLPPSELMWLEQDLAKTSYPSVIFSHQSLIESRTGIRNPQDFRAVVRKAPAGVLMAIYGHEHVDRLEEKEGIYYLCLNSMAYYWAGGHYEHTTYGEEIEATHPLLRHVFPYRDPLYAIIQITEDAINVSGTVSDMVGQSPESMNYRKEGLIDPITASINDRHLRLKR